MNTPSKDTRTSRQIVLDAIHEFAGLDHAITRENLQATTGLTQHIIDDHVSRMVDEEGTLRRVRPGVYELSSPMSVKYTLGILPTPRTNS